MSKNVQNYSTEEKRKKKRIAAIGIVSALLFLFGIGLVAAYYSDLFTGSQDFTSSTLRLNGTHTYYVNGTETAVENLKQLNPGDVIVVRGRISNGGNQSAWVREAITVDAEDQVFLSFLKIYEGEYPQESFGSGSEPDSLITLSETGTAVAGNKVLNGSGLNAQTESGEDFDYIGSSAYDFAYTIYFAHTATNATQGKTFGLTVTTQALQFRNNSVSEPDEAAWASVEAVT